MEDSTREREIAESTLQTRWPREVIEISKDAGLPFARGLGATLGASVEMRCCRRFKGLTL